MWSSWYWAAPKIWMEPKVPGQKKGRRFQAQLQEATGLPVALWDERRTTIDAHNILFSAGKNAKKRKKQWTL